MEAAARQLAVFSWQWVEVDADWKGRLSRGGAGIYFLLAAPWLVLLDDQTKRFILIRILWLLALGVSGMICYLSWVADSRMQLVPWLPHGLAAWADSGGLVEKMRTAVPVALASFLLALIGRLMGWKYWFVSGVGAVLILVIIAEVGQFFLPQRNPNWGDVLRGAAGAVVGLAAVLVLSRSSRWGRRCASP